ncbi:hypothetical protein [Paenibacillus wenxiniae]|uniref:Carboxypeptidase regulatory-like domain-containing protein n=1 Tax=Paenibacillus wenxiniae TaxID=1636843 RepID=A0ABW4RNZ7_9BACL
MNSSRSIRYRCSVVLRLIDSVTGGAPAARALKLHLGLLDQPDQTAPARVLPPLRGRALQPKGGGYYAASELEPGHYVLTVHSPDYMPMQLQWTLESQAAKPFEANLRLLPSSAYLYAERLTRVRCRCIGEDEQPVSGVDLFLRGSQSAAARARLRQAAEVGATELYVRATGTTPVAGEQMVLLSQQQVDEETATSASLERIQIAAAEEDREDGVMQVQSAGERCWKLTEPLQQRYPAGTPLLHLIYGQSDARGEALLVLPTLPGGATDYELSTGEGTASLQAHLTLKEGEALRVELNMASGQARIRNR